MSDSQNQRIISKMWERESCYNCGNWIQLLKEAMDKCGDYDDDFYDLWRAEPDKREAVSHSGYNIIKVADYWYWYHADHPQPFGNEPPADMKIVEHDNKWYYLDELEDFDPDDPQSDAYDSRDEALNAAWEAQTDLNEFDTEEEAINDCIDSERIDLDDYCGEVYEHYVVSGWLAENLTEVGETVREYACENIWCRQCTGQSIVLDSCMFQIANRMGILVGQPHEWKL